jgi:RNA polymerase sigma-70 factor (ECF subfamily)
VPSASDDELATEELFRRHASFVARFLFRLGAPRHAIEDLVQDVFLVVHRDGGYRPGAAGPTTYLAGVAVGLLANHRRRERTRALLLRGLSFARPLLSGGTTPAEALEADQTQRALARALDALDPNLRSVLVMADLEHLPCPEIASVLAIPVGTVYWRLHQAREQLVRELERAQRMPARLKREAHDP